jgi:hypothetical protein
MSARPSRWWTPPPKERPGDVLRWVRRVSVAGVVPLVAVALLVWGGEDRFLWPVIAVAAVVIMNAALMGPAIRRADERGSATDPDELARRRREGNRGLAVIVAVMLTAVPALGYVIYGAGTAAVLFAANVVYSVASVRALRRARD